MYSESTIRRKAYKIGYHVEKGFQHLGKSVFRDCDGDCYCGYMVKHMDTGLYMSGCFNENFDHLWTLNDVIVFLREKYQ